MLSSTSSWSDVSARATTRERVVLEPVGDHRVAPQNAAWLRLRSAGGKSRGERTGDSRIPGCSDATLRPPNRKTGGTVLSRRIIEGTVRQEGPKTLHPASSLSSKEPSSSIAFRSVEHRAGELLEASSSGMKALGLSPPRPVASGRSYLRRAAGQRSPDSRRILAVEEARGAY
ncbi:hypothetical protein KM043_008733 [Ampulex compressa]|nr:hypothetical protein KM043_008733 [Ampulex compressa]